MNNTYEAYQEYADVNSGVDKGQEAHDKHVAEVCNKPKYRNQDPERLWFDPDFNSDMLGV